MYVMCALQAPRPGSSQLMCRAAARVASRSPKTRGHITSVSARQGTTFPSLARVWACSLTDSIPSERGGGVARRSTSIGVGHAVSHGRSVASSLSERASGDSAHAVDSVPTQVTNYHKHHSHFLDRWPHSCETHKFPSFPFLAWMASQSGECVDDRCGSWWAPPGATAGLRSPRNDGLPSIAPHTLTTTTSPTRLHLLYQGHKLTVSETLPTNTAL